jgi:peroxiredoxin
MAQHDSVPPMCPVDSSPPTTPQEVLRQAMALDAPLAEQLAALAAGSRQLRPAVNAAYDDLVARLEACRVGSAAPQVGEPMPDFALPDQDGRLVSLESLLKKGPLVVSFNRGHWCGYCRLETRALARAHSKISEFGAGLVSIAPERAEFTRQFRRSNGLEFPVLCDVDLGYALNLGLVMMLSEDIIRHYHEAGTDLARFHGNLGKMLPVPATFVVGADGLIRARYTDPDFRRRMAVEDILAALKTLQGTTVSGSPHR